MKLATAAAILATTLCLGACERNTVTSHTPLFTAADGAGAPLWRPGLWSQIEGDCVFDSRKALEDWPKCAEGFPLGRHGLSIGVTGLETLLAAGDPLILQTGAKSEDSSGYWYQAIRPIRVDAQGRVTEVRVWPVLCGPPQPDPPADQLAAETPQQRDLRKITRAPIAGLEMKDGDSTCLARDPAVVRTAARLSEAWADPITLRRERPVRWWRGEGWFVRSAAKSDN